MSSSRHHHSSAESKSQKFWRSFLAFMLFLSVSALSLTLCVRMYFINDSTVADIFCNRQYVQAVQNDVLDFAEDLSDLALLPTDGVDEVITYDTIYEIENAYAHGVLGNSEQFTATTYQDYIADLNEELLQKMDEMIAKDQIRIDSVAQDAEQQYVDNITNYLQYRVEFPFMDKLATVVNIARTATLVAAAVFGVLSFLLILIVPSIGERSKQYRAVREIAYAFLSAGLLNLCLAGGVEIVKHMKTLVLYPTYLSDSIMRYVNSCIGVVCISSAALLLCALVIITIVWKIKRKNTV